MAAATERILYQHGDRHLYYAEGESLSWRLPLFVDFRHDRENDQMFALVQPAVCFFYNQMIAVNALLEVHDIQGKKDSWVIPKRICEAILHKAPGITPAFYYHWPDADAPPIDVKPPLRTRLHNSGMTAGEKNRSSNGPARRSFVEWLAKERKIQSSIINAVLDAISWDAPRWMVEHRRPLDLGFVRLVAVPFRANWKQIVAFKAKAHGIKLRALFNLPPEQVDEALEQAGLPAMLTSPHNVGLKRGEREQDVARIDYTIEAIATNLFESVANRIEGKRMARGPAAYVAEFEDAVEAVYKTAVQALRAYLKKVAAPFADVLGGSDPGSLGFKPVLGRHVKVRGTPLGNLPVHIVESGTRFSVFGQSSDRRLLPPTPDEVQALPAPFQAADDMREREVNGNLEYIGGAGDDRMRLCDGPEGRSPAEPMLAEPTPAGAGVGGEGDPVP